MQNQVDEIGDAAADRPRWQRLRRYLMAAVPAVALSGGAGGYWVDNAHVSTDDAFIRVAKASINARVSGQVVDVVVRDNQPVEKGQLLFRIDPEPYQIAVEQAEARLAGARIRVNGLKAEYRRQQADLQSAKDIAAFNEREFMRKKNLMESKFSSRSAFERAETDLKVARQRINSVGQQIANTVAALNGDPAIKVDDHPTVRAARAELDRAKLNLSYTRITAPDDGIVTKVDNLRRGDFVTSGSPVFWILSPRQTWVEANFRETGLTQIRPGQPATITVDAYAGHEIKAHVQSMSPGTGSEFSVLPPENATGNWVKVVQRLSVRLELDETDPKYPLFSGISVTASVDTGAGNTKLAAALGAR